MSKNGTKVSLADQKRVFYYRLSPLSQQSPMPEGSINGEYLLAMTGTECIDLRPILFGTEGLYQYRLEQIRSEEHPNWKCDNEVYTIHVYIKKLGGLSSSITVTKKSGEKVSKITFCNYVPERIDESIGGTAGRSDGIKTGDRSLATFWLLCSFFALITMAAVRARYRRKEL